MKSELLLKTEHGFYIICIFLAAILIVCCLIRAIRGPRLTDRIVCGNMIGTLTIVTIAILSKLMNAAYMLDVCLIYAMISFIAVVVFTKVYMGVYREKKKKQEEQKDD